MGEVHDSYYVRMKTGPKMRTMAIVAAAHSAEHIDIGLLTSMYQALGCAFHVTPAQVGTLTLCRGVVAAAVSPVAGVLSDTYDRAVLIAVGTLLWGVLAVGMGFAVNFQMALAFSALNGIGIAIVAPAVHAIIADLFVAEKRGRAFGVVFTITSLLGMLGSFYAVSIANKHLGSFEGWRVAFFTVAALSLTMAPLCWFGIVEPRTLLPKELQRRESYIAGLSWYTYVGIGVKHIFASTWEVLKIPTFLVLCVEHTVGSISYQSGYKILYFQLLGFSDVVVGAMTQCTTAGVALGFVLGGFMGDMLSKRFPNQARPFVNQLSLILSLPLQILVFKGMPASANKTTGEPGSSDKYGPVYAVLLFFLGLLAPWAGANNTAIFSEIVPSRLRSSVFALDKLVSGLLGALSAPLVGFMAERLFGYKNSKSCSAGSHKSADENAKTQHNALALENGLLWVFVVPTIIKLIVFSFLYWTLPRDRVCNEDYIEASQLAELQTRLTAAEPASDDLPDKKGPPGGPAGGAGQKDEERGEEDEFMGFDSLSVKPLAGDERVEIINPFAQYSAAMGPQALSSINSAIFEVLPAKAGGSGSALPRMLSKEMVQATRADFARRGSQQAQSLSSVPLAALQQRPLGGRTQSQRPSETSARPYPDPKVDLEEGLRGYASIMAPPRSGFDRRATGLPPRPAALNPAHSAAAEAFSRQISGLPLQTQGQLSTQLSKGPRPSLRSVTSLQTRMTSLPALEVSALQRSLFQQ